MAVRDVTVVVQEDGTTIATWADVDAGDTGKPVMVAGHRELAVQRTAGAGTITMEGSNDGTLFGALGAGVSADGTIKRIAEHPLFLRPSAAAASNNTIVLVASGPVRG